MTSSNSRWQPAGRWGRLARRLRTAATILGRSPESCDPESAEWVGAGRLSGDLDCQVWQHVFIAWHMRRPQRWLPVRPAAAVFWTLHGGPPGLEQAIRDERRRRQARLN